MFRKGLVGAALLVAVSGAYADAQWEVINQTSSATFYIDTNSIARTGNTVNVWTKAVNSTPRVQDGDQVPTAYGLDHFVFNCAEKTGALRAFARFDEKGNTIQSLSRKQYDMEAVSPDTPMAKLLQRVCQ
jgi:hypothetical protein